MEQIVINGGKPLGGEIEISGAKNAVLPLMCVSLLTDKKITLKNVPDLTDVKTLGDVLLQHGTQINKINETEFGFDLELTTEKITSTTAPYELVRQCGLPYWFWDHCWHEWGRQKYHCRGCAIDTAC